MQLIARRKAMDNMMRPEIQGQDEDDRNLLALKPDEELVRATAPQVHVIKEGVICWTDYRAIKRSPDQIVLEATEGFIPLWVQNVVLRWRFNTTSLSVFQRPEAIKSRIRALLGESIRAWGDAAPIRFTENPDNSDFEIVVERYESCTPQGCALAQAFFPDAGRHQLVIFPTMFQQSRK